MKKTIICLITAIIVLSALGIVYVCWDKKEMRENLTGQLLLYQANKYGNRRICRYDFKTNQKSELFFDGYEAGTFTGVCDGFDGDYFLVYREDEQSTILHVSGELIESTILIDFEPVAIRPYLNGVIAAKETTDVGLSQYEAQGYSSTLEIVEIYYIDFLDKTCSKIIDEAAKSQYGKLYLAAEGTKIAYSIPQYSVKGNDVYFKPNIYLYENGKSAPINIDIYIDDICVWLNESELLLLSNEKLYSFNIKTNKHSRICGAKKFDAAGTLNATGEYYVCSVFVDHYYFVEKACVTNLRTGRKIMINEIFTDGWNSFVWINE